MRVSGTCYFVIWVQKKKKKKKCPEQNKNFFIDFCVIAIKIKI